jgi:hypothetical protein
MGFKQTVSAIFRVVPFRFNFRQCPPITGNFKSVLLHSPDQINFRTFTGFCCRKFFSFISCCWNVNSHGHTVYLDDKFAYGTFIFRILRFWIKETSQNHLFSVQLFVRHTDMSDTVLAGHFEGGGEETILYPGNFFSFLFSSKMNLFP